MQSMKLLVFASCLVISVVVGGACRGQLPPTEPRRVVEDSPGTRTDDGLAAAPLAGVAAPSMGSLGGSGGTPPPLPGGFGGSLGQ